MDIVGEAAWRRHQAEEFAKAELMADEETRNQYLRMVEAYEAMADSEERAGRPPRSTSGLTHQPK